MKNRRLTWAICLLYCLLGMLIPLFVSVLGVRNRLDSSQPAQDIFIELPDRGELEQTFTAKHDFINIIVLNLKNPGLGNKGGFKFILQTGEGTTLVEQSFSGYNIEDPSSLRFQFDPISSSKDNQFTIKIQNLSSDKPPISVSASKSRELNYYVYYKTTNKKAAIGEYLGSLSKRFFIDRFFAVFWFLLVILLLRTAIESFRSK